MAESDLHGGAAQQDLLGSHHRLRQVRLLHGMRRVLPAPGLRAPRGDVKLVVANPNNCVVFCRACAKTCGPTPSRSRTSRRPLLSSRSCTPRRAGHELLRAWPAPASTSPRGRSAREVALRLAEEAGAEIVCPVVAQPHAGSLQESSGREQGGRRRRLCHPVRGEAGGRRRGQAGSEGSRVPGGQGTGCHAASRASPRPGRSRACPQDRRGASTQPRPNFQDSQAPDAEHNSRRWSSRRRRTSPSSSTTSTSSTSP